MKQRIQIYDWVRVISTLYVVIGHSSYLNIETICGGVNYVLPISLSSINNCSLLSFSRDMSRWVYKFHMSLFFMLSGSIFALKPIFEIK